MKIIDISWPISNDMTTYKNKKPVKIEPVKVFEKDKVRDTNILFNTHTGTHIDAPSHFLQNGKTVEQISIDNLIGSCCVLDFSACKKAITADDLKKKTIDQKIVLLKTKNSNCLPTDLFDFNFIGLSESGAEFLIEKNIKSVGIDYLGLENNAPGHPAHKLLMEQDIIIIEGLRLSKAQEKNYTFYCLPLALTGAEASPARAILVE